MNPVLSLAKRLLFVIVLITFLLGALIGLSIAGLLHIPFWILTGRALLNQGLDITADMLEEFEDHFYDI